MKMVKGEKIDISIDVKKGSRIEDILKFMYSNVMIFALLLVTVSSVIFFIFEIFGFVFFHIFVFGVELTPKVVALLSGSAFFIIMPIYLIYYVISVFFIGGSDKK